MTKHTPQSDLRNLPACAAEYIKLVIKKMRYRKKVRQDVQAELAAHFEDALKDCISPEEKEQKARQNIEEFGDAKVLGRLLRRAKKRCRPMWRTAAARTFQGLGILILCLVIYVAWFLSGKPEITTDYVSELNLVVRPSADESLNARALYEKAIELYEKSESEISGILLKRHNQVTAEDKRLITNWLAENKEIVDLLRAGNAKPYYWQQYEGDVEPMRVLSMRDLSMFRKLAWVLCWRAEFRAANGDYEQVFEDIKCIYRLGQHLRGDKPLVEQLVGMAIVGLAIERLRDILGQGRIEAAVLSELQNDLEKGTYGKDFTLSFKAVKILFYDEIQRCFTADTLDGGHLYFPRLVRFGYLDELISKDEKGRGLELSEVFLRIALFPGEWPIAARILFTQPNRQETMAMAERLYAFLEEVSVKSPAQCHAEGIDITERVREIVKGNLLLEILMPGIGNVNRISFAAKAGFESTLVIIGLLRYSQDKGFYPESLEQLAKAGYIKEVPIDPWSDKALIYRKTGDNFILYSVGRNFVDDGGKVIRTQEGQVRRWAEEGDWVFWPIEK